MKILFLSRWFPYPPSNGSKLRIYNLLQGLGHQHEVTLLSFTEHVNGSNGSVDTSGLDSFCSEICVVPWKPFKPQSLQARLGFFSLTPRSVIDTFSIEMKQYLSQILSQTKFDLVIASQVDMAVYSRYFRHIPALFEEVEIATLYERFAQASNGWHRLRHRLTWTKHRHYLASILKDFRCCTVVSDQERLLLSETVAGDLPVEVIPNCVDLDSYCDVSETPQPDTLIFTGSFSYEPNYEAMIWFLSEVYPLIQVQVPDVKLLITGDHGNRSLPPSTNVTLTGFVDDVRPLIAQSWASVVPLHTGGGTRLKILEAMALGTPVVATSKGAEGLDAQRGEHLLIADTPKAFARAVIDLLRQPKLRRQLSDEALQLIRKKYDWNTMMPSFLNLVERVAKN